MSKIILIGLDGVRLDVARNASPTLARLAANGVCTPMEMDPPTLSGPGWATLLTGARHCDHGIVDNTFAGSRLWSHPDLLSLAFYADQRTTTFAAASWPSLVDPAGPGPVIFPRLEQQRAGLHRVLVRDGETYGYRQADREVATLAQAGVSLGADLGFVYLGGVDEAGHLHGSVGPEYLAAIAEVEQHVAGIVAAVERRAAAAGEDWLVVVTTDHGHLDEGGHGGSSPAERASFTIAWRAGAAVTDWPHVLAPHELPSAILDRLTPGGSIR